MISGAGASPVKRWATQCGDGHGTGRVDWGAFCLFFPFFPFFPPASGTSTVDVALNHAEEA